MSLGEYDIFCSFLITFFFYISLNSPAYSLILNFENAAIYDRYDGILLPIATSFAGTGAAA